MGVGGRKAEGFYKFSKKKNLWPCNLFGKTFLVPPLSFSFLFKVCFWYYFIVVLTVIFKAIRERIFTIMFKH